MPLVEYVQSLPIDIGNEGSRVLSFTNSVNVKLNHLSIHKNEVIDVRTSSSCVDTPEGQRIVYLAQILYEPRAS